MSRIGIRPIQILEGVNVSQNDKVLDVESNIGKISLSIPDSIILEIKDNKIVYRRENESRTTRAMHGTIARTTRNAISDVKDGYVKTLTFKGTGYRARTENNVLILSMGYSHESKLIIPEEIKVSVVKNSIAVEGINRSAVGDFAAKVREIRPPEVYKGKGICYNDENIRRKAGKTASSGKV